MSKLPSFLLIAFLAISLFSLSSCSDNDGDSQPNSSSVCKLTTANYVTGQINFTYDAINRVTGISDSNGESLNFVFAGDSIISIGSSDMADFRFVTSVANNKVVRTRDVIKVYNLAPTGDSITIESIFIREYVYNTSNQVASINTSETSLFYTKNTGVEIFPPISNSKTETFTYTNNALTSISKVDEEGTFVYTFVPSSTKLADNNIVLFTCFEDWLTNISLYAAPRISFGEFMPARISGASTNGSQVISPNDFAFVLDNRGNITEIKNTGVNGTFSSTFTYNCN